MNPNAAPNSTAKKTAILKGERLNFWIIFAFLNPVLACYGVKHTSQPEETDHDTQRYGIMGLKGRWEHSPSQPGNSHCAYTADASIKSFFGFSGRLSEINCNKIGSYCTTETTKEELQIRETLLID